MAKLKLIDSGLLLDIIRASRPIPPSDQDLVLSTEANNKIDTLLQKPPTIDNKAKINSELNKQTIFLDKFYNKNNSPPSSPQPQQQQQEQQEQQEQQQQQQHSDNVLNFFGVQERKRAQPILNKLNSPHSKLTWDNNHRLVLDGRVIPQSNIYDLIKIVTGKSKNLKPTPGLQIFIKHLTDLNVPLHTAGTDKARRYLQTGEIDTNLDPLLGEPTNKRKRLETGSGTRNTKFVKKTKKIRIHKNKTNNCIIKKWV